MKKKLLIATLILLVINYFAQSPTNNILYVKKGSTGNGSSWSNALGEVADALKWAKQNGSNWTNTTPLQIWVAAGTYHPLYSPKDGDNFTTNPSPAKIKAFLLVKNVKLIGGFTGNETSAEQRNLTNNVSTLSSDISNNDTFTGSGATLTHGNTSDNLYHVLLGVGDLGSAEIDGFKITGAYSTPAVGNITVNGTNTPINYGGGIYLSNNSLKISNSQFFGNSANVGSAICNITSELKLYNVTFTKNITFAFGIIYSFTDDLPIHIINSKLYNNKVYGAGTYMFSGGNIYLINSLLTNSYNPNGNIIYLSTNTNLKLYNSIILGETYTENAITPSSEDDNTIVDIQNSLVQGMTSTSNGNIDATNYTITDILTNPTNENHTLKAGSIAIDAGSNKLYSDNGGSLLKDKDMSYFPRLSGCSNDLGPYEYQQTGDFAVWVGSGWNNNISPTQNTTSCIIGTYDISNNIITKNLNITSGGSLKIKANQSTTVYGKIIQSEDNQIILESDANLVQTDDSATNDKKKITVNRISHMRKGDYTYWSSPVTGQKLLNDSSLDDGFSIGTPNNRIYTYNESNDYFTTATDQYFLLGKGYAIRGKDKFDPNNLTYSSFQFIGSINNGNHTTTVQKSKNTGTSEHGYNLIGNPYPSNIDFEKFYNLGNNKDYINAKAWFWTNLAPVTTQQGTSYNGNNYATLTLTGAAPPTGDNSNNNLTPTKYIKVGQGFIVQVADEMTTTSPTVTHELTFNNSVRADGTGVFYNAKNNTENKDRYWLKFISPQKYTNTILIGYIDGATNLYDKNYDAELMTIADDSFYTLLDSQKMQIEGRQSPLSISDVIPIGAKFSENGTYQIIIGNKEGIFNNGQSVYLHDKNLNKFINLSNEDYTFQADKGTDDNRFEIFYRDNSYLGTETSTKQETLVYKGTENFIIKAARQIKGIQMFDTSGKLMVNLESLKNNEIEINHQNLPNGTYILKIQLENKILTKKVIK